MLEKQLELNEIIPLIEKELKKATSKFPEWPIDVIHAAGIVSEESGELVKTANEAVYEPGKFGYDNETDSYGSPLCELKCEAIQTAAMAIRFVMHLYQYDFNKKTFELKTEM